MKKVIGIVQLKGGAGRSTIATTLAAELSKQGQTTLIDCDMPQGTAEAWFTVRDSQGKASSLDIHALTDNMDLFDLVESLDGYVVLDAPPRVAAVTRTIMGISDLILIPLGASAAEIWATDDLLDTLEEARAEYPDIDYRIVWNKYRGYTRSAKELSKAVKKEMKIPELKTRLGYRVAYMDCLSEGLSASESRDKVAGAEVESLAAEVKRILARK